MDYTLTFRVSKRRRLDRYPLFPALRMHIAPSRSALFVTVFEAAQQGQARRTSPSRTLFLRWSAMMMKSSAASASTFSRR